MNTLLIKLCVGIAISTAVPTVAFAWSKSTCGSNNSKAACASLPEEMRQSLEPESIPGGRIVMAFGTDGCLASSPIWNDGGKLASNPGIKTNGKMSVYCDYKDQLPKAYVLYNEIPALNNSSYTARVFALYAVKDESKALGIGSHRHEWEHTILWMKDGIPQFISHAEHKDVKTKSIDNAAHLKGQQNLYAVKYIAKATTHYLDFASGDKNNEVTNNNPSPIGRWFGEDLRDYVDYKKTNNEFKQLINTKSNWGATVPRIDDKKWLNDHIPSEWKGVVSFK